MHSYQCADWADKPVLGCGFRDRELQHIGYMVCQPYKYGDGQRFRRLYISVCGYGDDNSHIDTGFD